MHTYEIRVQGQLDQRWSEWFDGLVISHDAGGTRSCVDHWWMKQPCMGC